jgi:hypothetical protein
MPDFSKMKIESAETDKVSEVEDIIERILDVVGHPEAYVTDESMISDFFDIGLDKKGKAKEIERVRKCLGVDVSIDDYLFEIALRMKESRTGR